MCRTAAERTLAAELAAQPTADGTGPAAVRPVPDADRRGPHTVRVEPPAGRPAAYAAELPGARAAVLTRLWRGLVHEPIPWVSARTADREGVTLRLADGRRLRGPLSDPWATAASVAGLELDGVPFDHPAELMAALTVPQGGRLAVELDHSVASMALSRTAPPRPVSPARPWEWEQQETDGHPYHPGCRSRPGFCAAEQLAYAPEHRPVVALRLAAVTGAAVSGEWPAALRDGRALLIPVHPWQAAHVLSGKPLRPGPDGHPLLSLRTLDIGGDTHVKTALSTQLTSTRRDISAYTITHAVAASAFAEGVARRLDGRLHIARTLAAAGDGTADLAAILREAPHVHADAAAGEQVVPVAALPALFASCAPGERLGRTVEFARLALGACLDLLDLGVALEAHGQNLLAVIGPDGRARRLVYRDLADIRISPAQLARHGIPAPPVTGRLLNDDPAVLHRKVLGSLVTGALGPLAGDAPTLGTILEAATRDLAPTPALHALRTQPLPAKALTRMRLDGPAARGGRRGPGGMERWMRLPNPLTR